MPQKIHKVVRQGAAAADMARRPLALMSVALCLLLCLSSSCKGDEIEMENVVTEVDAAKLAAWTNEVRIASVTAQSAVQQSDLPVSRPQSRDFCDYGCASKIVVKVKDAAVAADKLDNGLLYISVRFRPISQINSTMVRWMFENLAGRAVSRPDNKTFPMYLIFHPRDHVVHRRTGDLGSPIVKGTNLTWCEMILTNCKYDKEAAYNPTTGAGPWTCPSDAAGYLRSTPVSEWESKYQTKETMTVQWFNESGIEFSRIDNRELLVNTFGGPRVVATTRHTWTRSPNGNGLIWTTQLWIGIMADGSTTEFDTSFFAPFANDMIKNTIMDGVSNLNGNVTQLAWMNVLHFLEEYHGTRLWLPQLWRGRNRPRNKTRTPLESFIALEQEP